jgi:hypothetical protein
MDIDKTTMFLMILGLSLVILAFYFSWTGIIGAASFVLAIVNQSRKYKATKERKEQLRETQIKPSIAPIIDLVHKVTEPAEVSWAEIDELSRKAVEKLRDEGDLTSLIVGIMNDMVGMMKLEGKADFIKYRRSYALALAYRVSLSKDLQNGQVARSIDSAVRKRKIIKCYQETWQLTDDEIDWYVKFSSSEDIFMHPFGQLFQLVHNLDSKEIAKERDANIHQASVLQKHLNEKEEKLQKLLKIILRRIPLGDFLRLISSLRSNVVIISLQGTTDPEERAILQARAPSGRKYLKQVFEAEKLRLGKINDAVYFVFLRDIIPAGQDPKYFDIETWGRNIAEKARSLREIDKVPGRKFNFIVAKTSIYEIKSFGDELSKSERKIDIPEDMLESIKSEDLTFSALLTMAEILRSVEDVSIFDFINKNIEYLDGIPDPITAEKVSRILMEKYHKREWLIVDFIKYGVKVQDLEACGIPKEQASRIIKDAEVMSKIIPA